MHPIKSKGDSLTLASNETPRLIRIRSVLALTGLSKSYTYELCSKGLFPKSVQLVPGGTSVAWVESEVLAWIDSRIVSRDAEDLKHTTQ
jgi:prophage regulatory protein